MSITINRRNFLANSSISAGGIVLGAKLTGCNLTDESVISSYDIMQDAMKYRKIDAHCHVGLYGPLPEDADKQIDSANRMGIEFLSISKPITRGEGTPEEFKEYNNTIHSAMKLYPQRFVGFFTVNPLYQKESLEEIKRCADLGFAGYKGYTQAKVNDPLYYPIIEKLIDHKMICFMHAICELGRGGYRMKYKSPLEQLNYPTIPEDMADAAGRYPEAMFQWAHIASGDFEYICKCIKDYPNIYVDVSGSNNDEKHVDFCIEHLGEDRIFFGSDNSFYQSVGKILASNTNEAQRRKIFFDNYNNILKKGGHNVA